MNTYRADIQLHSCLSPCGSLESSPRAIARAAVESGLDIIALTDHNTAANCPALAAAIAEVDGLTCFFGAEVTTAEEIHLICLFGSVAIAVEFGDEVRAHLPSLKNDPAFFGDQPVVDLEETVLKFEDALLAGATDLPLEDVVEMAHQRHGLAIAAHIDRPINSLFSQLGIWPDHVELDACDLSPRAEAEEWRPRLPPEMPIIRTSDAHFPRDIGSQWTVLAMAAPTFDELCLALRGAQGRAVLTTGRRTDG
jgi:PHP family Zn ribbon phosphoesterase